MTPLPRSSEGRRGDRGQAAVELALVLPLVIALALILCQVALVVRDQVLVVHAAREAGRAAAVDADPGAARQAALASGSLDGGRLAVDVAGRGEVGSRVRVTIRYRSATSLPLVGPMVGDVELSGSATVRVEN